MQVQPMDCKALAQGREPLLKIALIQLAHEGSILSITLAHCVAGRHDIMQGHPDLLLALLGLTLPQESLGTP